ncbi:MAG TPA: Glu/Leu/Phe/Val dehydrogenase, partial [Blastocatellia bacterium]
DMNTNEQTMAWIMDTISMFSGSCQISIVTGKPLYLGGSQGRAEATARGCQFVVREACKLLGINLDGARVVVQGYGNAGSIAARLLAEDGAKVIAVSDSRGSIFNVGGLDPTDVMRHKNRTGSVSGYKEADAISRDDMLALECEVLIPAALENEITMENAASIRARIIAEAANGPVTPAADSILFDNGVFGIPDILANAGGVTVSYFEWVQDRSGFFWENKEVDAYLEKRMVRAFHDVHQMSERYKVDMRAGAYCLAIGRVAEATRTRGIFP